jgi:hypothetical protein
MQLDQRLPRDKLISVLLEVDCLFAEYLIMRSVHVRLKFHEGLDGYGYVSTQVRATDLRMIMQRSTQTCLVTIHLLY